MLKTFSKFIGVLWITSRGVGKFGKLWIKLGVNKCVNKGVRCVKY